ncbi:UNVERIFIED_CONTAM: hypothetical protein RMT77_007455 [Armadillidium vulgare]
MKTPSNSHHISQAWVEYILTQYECKKVPETVLTVKYFTISKATKPGESFNAELVKMDVTAKLKRGDSGPSTEKLYNLIVKFLSRDPFNREMIRSVGYHKKEYQMYSEVLPKLNQFQASRTNNAFPIFVPEFIYGKCTRKEYVLVIENMKDSGYGTSPKGKGLNVEQVYLALERIAWLHGVSYAYNKHHDFLCEFPNYTFSKKISKLFKHLVLTSVENVIPFLQSQEGYEDIAEKLKTGKEKLPEKFHALWEDQSRHAILCLTHGDFWCSNLLFNPPEGSPEHLAIIDWQISQWNSPIFDIQYLFATSATNELLCFHLQEFLQHYHRIFINVTKTLEAPVPNYSFEEFHTEFKRLSLVGLLMGITVIQGTLSKAGEKINPPQTINPSFCSCTHLKNHILSLVAKIVIPFALRPSGKCILKLSIKKLLDPIGRELLEGKNEEMNERLLEHIKEGHRKRLLDVLNM